MNLNEKMGMIINSVGDVVTVLKGGQAQESGIEVGSRIIAVGSEIIIMEDFCPN
jgi:predicted metalloprotease with PDZ domain